MKNDSLESHDFVVRQMMLNTYRNNNLGSIGTLDVGLALAVNAVSKDLLELDTVVVGDLVADNVAAQLGDEVHEGLGTLGSKCNVAGAAASRSLEGSLSSGLERLAIKGVNVDLVESKIGDEQVLLGGIEDSLVRVRTLLAIGVGALAGVGFEFDVLESRGLGNVPGRETIAATDGG